MNADKTIRSIRNALIARLESGETYRSIGEGTGLSRTWIHQIANGRQVGKGRNVRFVEVDPRFSTVVKLVNYLGIEVS